MIHYLPEENDDSSEEADALRVGEEAAFVTGYKDLRIYSLAHELGVAAHHLSLRLPKYEMYETGSQLRRAAKSVSANIVEGYGRRRYKAEFLRFLIFSKASLDETEEHLQYVLDCHSEQKEAAILLNKASELGRRMHRFMEAVDSSHRT